MKLFEFEAKELLRKGGIPVPDGVVAETPEEVAKAYNQLGGNVALKSQVLVGGRGKTGGIRFPKSGAEACQMAAELLNGKILGEPVEKILVEKALDIEHEFYLGIITDPDEGCPLLMFSAEGGVEIEELAALRPDAIRKIPIDPRYGLFGHKLRYELKETGIPPEFHNSIIDIAKRMYQTYWDMDGALVEINPLVVTAGGHILAVDAKFNIDDSGLFRQAEVPKRPAKTLEDRAAEIRLSYVLLNGNIGLISNGAGLTMAAMDHLAQEGASPANFLDLGGQATQAAAIKNAITVVLENPKVTALLIYIFAGGPRCDVIADGIVESIDLMERGNGLQIPIVVTLHGCYAREGMKVLSTCESPHLYPELEVEDAMRKVVKLGRSEK
jgi:succinyl-CoA synthetase beta subunit